ncbi:hypothetical protein C1T31_00310 [Hanstruepera neustonica]|uniref:Uncharacterized protein n=1 Tax=Hanstruepera neustonica TaxID=1445657 RepID=A0A2K1E2Y0_9FLAO|nr:hypothetical protein [Hanstruepera neustonica]PNQ74623.1 hypothetical protein C1T31_00310 [Hanstruepera neustonica]
MKTFFKSIVLSAFFLMVGTSKVFGQSCREIISNEYDADTDIEYSQLIGGIIYDDKAKSVMTGIQDIVALYAGKTIDGELLVYMQHTRYVDSHKTNARDNLSIGKDKEVIIIGSFGKITLNALKDQSPTSEDKAMSGSTKNKICQVYPITAEDLEKLCSGLINTVIVNYDTAPKLIKKIKEKDAKKHLKYWACSPKELNK